MKISRKKLIELVSEIAAGELGGPGATQYMSPDEEVASAPSADDQFAADMADKAAADVRAYGEDRTEAMSKIGEFDGEFGDPYTYDYDEQARGFTAKNKVLYATAATKEDPDHPDADPITGHVSIGKSFQVPLSSGLYDQIMAVYGDEIDAALAAGDRVAQLTGAGKGLAGKSKDAVRSSTDAVKSSTDIFNEANIQLMISQEITRHLIREVNLNKVLKDAEDADTPEAIDALIQKVNKKEKPRTPLKALVTSELESKKAALSKPTNVPPPPKAPAADLEADTQSQEDEDIDYGEYAPPGDPYTYNFVRWNMTNKNENEQLYMVAKTRTDKKTGAVEQIRDFFYCPKEGQGADLYAMVEKDHPKPEPKSTS